MASYTPEAPPQSIDPELQEYLMRELSRIGDAVLRTEEIVLGPTNVTPAKPEEGAVIYADGVNFNPGSGEGFYGYINGAWVKLSILSTDDVTMNRLRLLATNDATLASTLHALQIGTTAGANLVFDINEIQARNNGAIAILIIQEAGGATQHGSTAPFSDAGLVVAGYAGGNDIEFGHSNTAGYRSVLGHDQGSGPSFLIFNGRAGTNANTYRSDGLKSSIIKGDTAGGTIIGYLANANADNQAITRIGYLKPTGTLLLGTTTNDNAAAGDIGEIASASTAAPGGVLTTNIALNVTSVSLTAGDWEVWANVGFTTAATTSVTHLAMSLSTVSATLNFAPGSYAASISAAIVPGAFSTKMVFPSLAARFSLAATTTVYLVALGTFTVAGLQAFGQIHARRAR